MGCAASVPKATKDELEASRQQLQEERNRLQEKDAQIASIQDCLREQMKGFEQASSLSSQTLDTLRAEIEARKRQHDDALLNQRQQLLGEHQSELNSVVKAREESLMRSLGERQEEMQQEAEQHAATRQEAEELAKAELASRLTEAQLSRDEAHAQQCSEVEAARMELDRLRSQVAPLKEEHFQAAEALREARRSLRLEQEDRASGSGRAAMMEQRLAEAQRDHERAEQRHGDLQQHLKVQLRDLQSELQARAEELRERDAVVLRRDQELAEVNTQLSDLQGLFDEVNGQLQTECGRIEHLQGAVTICAQKTKELEALQKMLEESHQMLAQLRETLEQERAERLRVAGLLEHEQQRTQLLLDVLKHFKEKLQGLTPQMLMSRLGVADSKALLAGTGPAGALAALDLNSLSSLASPLPKGATPPGPAMPQGAGTAPAAAAASQAPCAMATRSPAPVEPAWFAPSPAHYRQQPVSLDPSTGPMHSFRDVPEVAASASLLRGR